MVRKLTRRKLLGLFLGIFLLAVVGGTVKVARSPTLRMVLVAVYEVKVAMWLKDRLNHADLPWSCRSGENRFQCFQGLAGFWLPEKSTTITGRLLVLALGTMILTKDKAENLRPLEVVQLDLVTLFMNSYEHEIRRPESERPASFVDRFCDPEEVLLNKKTMISMQKKFILKTGKMIEGRLDRFGRSVASAPPPWIAELKNRYESLAPYRKVILEQEGLPDSEEGESDADTLTES